MRHRRIVISRLGARSARNNKLWRGASPFTFRPSAGISRSGVQPGMADTTLSLDVLIACMRAVERLVAAGFQGDIYKQAFSDVAHIPVSSVTDEQRKAVKQVSFAAIYGGTRVEQAAAL